MRGRTTSGSPRQARPARRGTLGALALTAGLVLVACGRGAPRTNALLVTLDTTRADALTPFGAAPGLTPTLDRLAREGIVWTEARTVVPLTLPSHTSMLTGLYPPRHGIRTNGSRVPTEAETLAETARAHGYQTAAFVAAPVLASRFGLNQGFDLWDEPALLRRTEHADDHYGALTAEEVTERASAWLRGGRDPSRPFFLFLHYFDPHRPWDPPRRCLKRAAGNPYLAEVARVDDALARIVETLEQEGLFDATAILVAGDHGEGLDEHGEGTHGHFVYESTLRIPLLFRPALGGAGEDRRGSADRGLASAVDVHPTLARALGLEIDLEELDGVDLLAGPLPVDRGVYFECYYGFLHLGWSPLAGWADASGKYVHSPTPEFYVPRTWPDERVNRIHERGEDELEAYRAHIAAVAARPRLVPNAPEEGVDLAAGLSALGYAEGRIETELPEPLAPSDLPSPHTRAAELRLLDQARAYMLDGELERGAEAMLEVLRVNPRNASALEARALMLLQSGRAAEALDAYERLLALTGPTASIHGGLGRALERTGRLDEAIPHYRRAVELVPFDVGTLRVLTSALERTGASDEAARWRAELQRELGY